MGPLIFLTSGDVSPGFETDGSSRFPLFCGDAMNTSEVSATAADLLTASTEPLCPNTSSGAIETVKQEYSDVSIKEMRRWFTYPPPPSQK